MPRSPTVERDLEKDTAASSHTVRVVNGDHNLTPSSSTVKFHDSSKSGVSSAPDVFLGSTPRIERVDSLAIQYRTISHQLTHPKEAQAEKHGNQDDVRYFEKLEFHKVDVGRLCQQFNTDAVKGLDDRAVKVRQERDGLNTFTQKRPSYIWKVLGYLFGGFCSVLWVGVLVFFLCWQPLSDPPSVINLALALFVIGVIVLQASFSAAQDFATGRVMNSILNLLPSECVVIRNGESLKTTAAQLVTGDVILLATGNKVPADCRIIESSGDVRFDRAILTGESDEIEGSVDKTDESFLETYNIALMGTHVTNGHAKGVVVLTGGRSVMGRISNLTSNTKEQTTMIQQEINRFVRIIVVLTVILASLIFFAWLFWIRVDHYSFINLVGMLNNVMGCVVAFIPEGMPMAVTLTLSLIARRMKDAKVLPKSLATVETLGCVNVLCSDKTGTLTENRMVCTSIGFIDLDLDAQSLQQILAGSQPSPAAQELHRAATLCNDATFEPSKDPLPPDERPINGNATDAAVLRLVTKVAETANHKQDWKLVHAIPFNSRNKWALTMFESQGSMTGPEKGYQVYVKGAPDVLAPACTSYWSAADNTIRVLDDEAREAMVLMQEAWSMKGQRVIMICSRRYVPTYPLKSNKFSEAVARDCMEELTVIGLLGIMDPPRPETAKTVADCRRAGLRFFMVTGDFELTAAAIGKQVGIITRKETMSFADVDKAAAQTGVVAIAPPDEDEEFIPAALVLTGKQISECKNEHWDVICRYEEIVFARTSPEQKLLIVNHFKTRGSIVAVTGDGVNDAPALKAADVGIAVVSGSDVAIEAASLVLMGNFDSIVAGIRLGRLVFQNLQKTIGYLLPAGSWSEIWPVLFNVFLGTPLPLSSFLMIIICVFTDLLCCLSLIMEKEEFDLLSAPPRKAKKEHLVTFKLYGQSYLFMGTMMTVIAHSMFFLYMYKYGGFTPGDLFFAFENFGSTSAYTADELTNFVNTGQCVYFVTLVILQWGNLFSIRNKRLSVLQADPFRKERRNLWLLLGIAVAFLIAVFVTEVPAIQSVFQTARVPIEFWLYPLPFAFGILFMDEARKLCVRAFPRSIVARIAW
ncbi:hypothetical protein HDU90_000027 [Geranomyces variabilis]|nr:hypothetical protein HDU90_000027 [Geranomyces variabilis]